MTELKTRIQSHFYTIHNKINELHAFYGKTLKIGGAFDKQLQDEKIKIVKKEIKNGGIKPPFLVNIKP